jgi:maltose O-acetyltransferase
VSTLDERPATNGKPPPKIGPNPMPGGMEARPLRQRLLSRLRGEISLETMRKRGLRAEGPVRIGVRSHLDANFAWAIEIGSGTIIGNDVRVIAHDASMKATTGYIEVRPVKIGAGCYLGSGVVVLPGATIGDGAVIGAGALVRGEIPPRALAVGMPAKVVGSAEEYHERHVANLSRYPRWDRWRASLSPAELEQVRAEMHEHGRVYFY